MEFSTIIFFLLSIRHVLSSGAFFRGHLEGYDIPPPKTTGSRAEVTTNYFSQRVDHFDPSNTNAWLQRYYVNPEYFNTTERETVFLMIGGEGQASIGWLTTGAWIQTAQRYGALLIQLEHRFYGVSHPFEDLSTENLRFLSSRQALEDTASFINGINQEYNLTDPKWIVFGGSYAGSLAAWLRQKYPHLVQGAMSSSGPLHAQLDFPEYFQVVADDLATHSRQCVDVVKTAFTRVEELVDNPGEENVTALFNLCDDIEEVNSVWDIANFLQSIVNVFAYVAQYNKNSVLSVTIDDLCDILVNETYGDEVQRLIEVNKLYYGSECVDYKYESTLEYLRDVNITPSGNMRQWIYQTCTEYGWYQTSSQEEQVFGTKFPIDHYTKMCEDVYGSEFNASYISGQIERTNTLFGGYDIDVRNVVFVHGSFDPWHPLGVLETTIPESPVIFISGTSHCMDLYSISSSDPPELAAAKQEVQRLIGVWLGAETSAANRPISMPLLNTLLLVISYLIISKLQC